MESLADLGTVAIFILVLAVFALVAGKTKRRQPRSQYRGRRHTPAYHLPPGQGVPRAQMSAMPDAADQLRAVENAHYGKQPLLRFQESKVFAAAEAAVQEAGAGWRVFAQVSLGEVLTCEDRDGFNAINAKRVDLLIADAKFTPLAAIEYQGTGHHLGKAAARDAVKKEALRKAGIGYIEITHDHGPDDVRREIARLAFTRIGAANTARRVIGR